MSKKWIVAAILTLLVITPSYAHHGTAAYSSSNSVTITGTVTAFEFVNPHVLITVEGKNASGKTEKWIGELTSPNFLARVGWTKNTLKSGDEVTIIGSAAKSGTPTMIIHSVMKGGKEIELYR